jgi:ABC-type transport system substrate-binding protein
MPTRRAVLGGAGAAAVAATTGWWILEGPRPAAERALRIGFIGRGDIATLDPAQAGTESPIGIAWNIFDRLVQRAPDGTTVPRLAESWSTSPDRLEWRFRIRRNVRFQAATGAPTRLLTPADVIYSLTRAVRVPGYGRTLLVDVLDGAAAVAAGEARSISGLRVEGEEVVFRLLQPFNFLLDRLSTSFLSIVPEGSPDGGPAPMGTGPYELVSFDQARQMVMLRRFEGHWDRVSADAPETIVIRAIASEALGAAELKSGGLDYVEFNSSALSVMRAQAAGAYRIEEYPHTELRLVALNQTKPPFNGPHGSALGQSLNLGVDRAALVSRIGGGAAFGGPVPLRGYEAKQFLHDQARARTLTATLPESVRQLEMLVEPVDEARILAELLVRQWAEVGLSVTAVYGRADFFPKAAAGNYQMALAYYGPYVASPEQYLWMYRAAAAPIPNVMRFDDRAFETTFHEYVTVDGNAQQAALSAALDRLLERPPTVWILKPPRLSASRSKINIPRAAGLPFYAQLKRG